MYEVDCAYPTPGFAMSPVLDAELNALGHRVSSGVGLGYRDMQFRCETEEEAENLARAIHQLFEKHDIPVTPVNTPYTEGKAYVCYYKLERSETDE